jgi:hypothetical protein
MKRLKALSLATNLKGPSREEASIVCCGSIQLARDTLKLFLEGNTTNQELANAYIALRIDLYRLGSTLTNYKFSADKASYRGVDSFEVIQATGELTSLLKNRAEYDAHCLTDGVYLPPVTETIIKNSDYNLYVATVKLANILDNIADQFEGDQFEIAIDQSINRLTLKFKGSL